MCVNLRWGGCGMSEQGFASRLKSLREQAGLSQAELAQCAGMNRFGIAKLEQGVREPSWATVQALARALGVEVGAFVVKDGETAEKPPQMGRPRKAPAVAQETGSGEGSAGASRGKKPARAKGGKGK